ncbi:hypothetical protein EVAR_53769_1 [Eumeta japonica]|uniref:Uncharacterized protein n=1 Tax=Eumeta variegata TaxID=151549 RepID=A0A4C1Z0Q4_EUMVA|nr:hypothetical protein EVAR_53769_1 [Eumeta japonica]
MTQVVAYIFSFDSKCSNCTGEGSPARRRRRTRAPGLISFTAFNEVPNEDVARHYKSTRGKLTQFGDTPDYLSTKTPAPRKNISSCTAVATVNSDTSFEVYRCYYVNSKRKQLRKAFKFLVNYSFIRLVANNLRDFMKKMCPRTENKLEATLDILGGSIRINVRHGFITPHLTRLRGDSDRLTSKTAGSLAPAGP